MFLCFLVFFSVLDCISLLLMRLRHIFFKKNLCAHCEIESSYCWRDGWRGLRPKRGGGIACICPMYLCPLWWNLIEFIPPNCRAAVYLIPLRWRPDHRPEEFPETWGKNLHPKKPPLCGESAPRYYRGRDEKVVWEVWQGRWSLHTQGQRLWLYQAGEWPAALGVFWWQWTLEECL